MVSTCHTAHRCGRPSSASPLVQLLALGTLILCSTTSQLEGLTADEIAGSSTSKLISLARSSKLVTTDELDELLDGDASPRQALSALLAARAAAQSQQQLPNEDLTKKSQRQLADQAPEAVHERDGAEDLTKKYWLRCSRADNYTGCYSDRTTVLGTSVNENENLVSMEQAATLKTKDILARLHRHEQFLMPWPRTAEWEYSQYQEMSREPANLGGHKRKSYSERWWGSSLSGNNPLRIEEIRAIIADGGPGPGPKPSTPEAIQVLRGETLTKERDSQRSGVEPISVPWKELKKIWRLRLARELLMAGESEEALDIFETLCSGKKNARLSKHKCLSPLASSMADQMLRDFLALAWIRLAEQENCISDHTHESCIAPIRGAGVHQQERGARGAIEILNASLGIFPGDLSSVFLLNLAHQQLGAPEPESLAIDAALVFSDKLYSRSHSERYGDFPRFLNVAAPLKLDTVSLAGGIVVDDFTNDGLLDVASSGDGLHDQLRVYINSGDGAFDEFTSRSDLLGEDLTGVVGGINLCHTDYDNDGNIGEIFD